MNNQKFLFSDQLYQDLLQKFYKNEPTDILIKLVNKTETNIYNLYIDIDFKEKKTFISNDIDSEDENYKKIEKIKLTDLLENILKRSKLNLINLELEFDLISETELIVIHKSNDTILLLFKEIDKYLMNEFVMNFQIEKIQLFLR